MAATDGTVIFSGADGPYGNVVRLLDVDGVATWYAHLDERLVDEGSHVRAGDVVGLVGATGNSTGPHLHFEVRLNASISDAGTATDPRTWLQQQGALP
jgi:murein DD-endopeptidase MepM/ murein hydrolase activator NlpD